MWSGKGSRGEEIILDYSGRLSVITGTQEELDKKVVWWWKQRLDWSWRKRPYTKEYGQLLTAEKDKETDSPFIDSRMNQPCQQFDFGSGGTSGKESICLPVRETKEVRVRSLDLEDPLEEEMACTPLFLSGESHGQRIL